MSVHISSGNSKMGSIRSVSLPAVLTCRPDCPCASACYANRMMRFRKSVRKSYLENLEILKSDPDQYWREVEAAIMLSRFFRFHVAGDIVNADYLTRMTTVAERNTHCEILCFTKRYELINAYLNSGASIAPNLHIIMSAWRGLPMENPYLLPEAHVLYKDGSTTARSDAIICSGNCTDCAETSGGCWSLTTGQQILFKEH